MGQSGIIAGKVGRLVWAGVAGLAVIALASPAHAEDLKGRWYFGGHLGYLSTTDDIRSNADIIIGPLGDDNIPFTGDPNEEQGCVGAISASTYCDPRSDDLLSRETSIEETFQFGIDGGFGITSWLNLQVNATYFKGDVGPIDTYLRDHFPISGNPVNPNVLDRFKDREQVIPVQAGVITEIPVSLTLVARFRKDSPMNPYVGVGAGMIFANIDNTGDVEGLNARLGKMRIRQVANEWNDSVVPAKYSGLVADGRIPFTNALDVDVDDSFEWHLIGGAEYFLNDKMSLVFDARYLFADEYLQIDLGGEDQINLQIFSEEMFRADGSVQIFAPSGVAPNTRCEDTAEPDGMGGFNYVGVGCNNLPNGYVSPPPNFCPASGDFDGDGRLDRCYGQNVGRSPAGIRDPRGDVIVQGGRINLGGFAAAIGMRFHF